MTPEQQIADLKTRLAAGRLVLGVLGHILCPRKPKPTICDLINAAEQNVIRARRRRGCVVSGPRRD